MVQCPVCSQHGELEALQSEQVVLAGVRALISRDTATIKNVYDSITPLDAHVAITLLAAALADMYEWSGQSMQEGLDETGEAVTKRLQELLQEATGPTNPTDSADSGGAGDSH